MVGGDPTAVGVRRTLGAAIELVLLGIGMLPVFIVIAEKKPNYGLDIGCTSAAGPCVNLGSSTYLLTGARLVLFGVVAIGFHVLVVGARRGANGRSVGMNVVGLRLVNADGDPPGAIRGIVRSLLGVVDALPWSLPVVGLSMIAIGRDHQRFGDRVTGTFVVHERDAGQPVLRAVDPITSPRRGITAVSVVTWFGVAVGVGLSGLILAVVWTAPLMIDLRACGSVLSPSGSCPVGGRALAASLLLWLALLPAAFIAWPCWMVGAVLRRRSRA